MSDAPGPEAPASDEVSADAAADTAAAAEVAPDAAGGTADAPKWEPDEVLLGSVALAQRALLEVTAPETVGSVVGHVAEGEHVLSLHFAADLSGYPGWHWSVTLARVEDGEPTVLETELLPGERALLAPEWVPWSERLADYRAAQAAAAAEAAERGEDDAEEPEAGSEEVDEESDAAGEPDDEEFADADETDDTDDDDVFDGIDIDALADEDDDVRSDLDADDSDADDDGDDSDDD